MTDVAEVVSWSQPVKDTWLGLFGEQWVDMLCCETGLACSHPRPDRTKTDTYIEDDAGEVIRAQIKTTEHPTTTKAGYSFSLEVEAYDRLRAGSSLGYLLLIVVHDLHPKWVRHFPGKGSVVKVSGYWARLTDLPDVTTQSVTVSLPFENVLVPESVRGLFAW